MIEHLSHSSITAADECLKKYHVTRLADEKPVDVPADARDIGILVHAYIEAWFKGEEALAKLAEQSHSTHHEEALAIFGKWKNRFKIDEDNWLFTERYGEFVLDGVPKLIGYDDFVYLDNGITVIRDFKTGFGTEVYPSYEFQLDLAMLRYEAEFKIERIEAEIEFVRSGIISPRRKWTPERRAATIDRLRTAWARIQSEMAMEAEGNPNAWLATPGSHCNFCPIKAQCAVARRAQAQGLLVVDEDSARKALNEIALMDEAKETLKAALRTYVDAYGEVQAGEGKYDYVARNNTSVGVKVEDPKKVVEIVGLENIGKALKIDTKGKDGQKLLEDDRLSAIITKGKVSSRFYVGKNKESEDEE